jgi:hypothetical protein
LEKAALEPLRRYNSAVDSDERRWVDNWATVGPLLEAQRRHELVNLSPERALFYAEALFSVPWPEEVLNRRRRWSGLIEQQDLFQRLRPR